MFSWVPWCMQRPDHGIWFLTRDGHRVQVSRSADASWTLWSAQGFTHIFNSDAVFFQFWNTVVFEGPITCRLCPPEQPLDELNRCVACNNYMCDAHVVSTCDNFSVCTACVAVLPICQTCDDTATHVRPCASCGALKCAACFCLASPTVCAACCKGVTDGWEALAPCECTSECTHHATDSSDSTMACAA